MSDRDGQLALSAGVLAVIVAGVHLYWGIPRFTNYASVWVLPDPRPLAFVLSGHAILLALTLVAAGVLDRTRIYLPGMALMLVHLLGYAAWHTVLTHGASGEGHSHAGSYLDPAHLLAEVAGHLLNSPLALVSKTTEFAVLLLLAALAVRERRDATDG